MKTAERPVIRIHCLQHVPFEGLGYIASWVTARGHSLQVTRLYDREMLPASESFDWLIVMGGPMNIYEEDVYPWLAEEKKFIARAIGEGKIILGICLGAQLIADVLGARVSRNEYKEIGWYPVTLTEQGRRSPFFNDDLHQFPAFHWHGDTFDLPTGANRLAESDGCRNQAFSYADHVLALQFHLESTPASIRDLIVNCGEEIIPGPYVQNTEDMSAEADKTVCTNRLMERILEELSDATEEKS
jgi:GMP synthase-like glutamine amidotransferase